MVHFNVTNSWPSLQVFHLYIAFVDIKVNIWGLYPGPKFNPGTWWPGIKDHILQQRFSPPPKLHRYWGRAVGLFTTETQGGSCSQYSQVSVWRNHVSSSVETAYSWESSSPHHPEKSLSSILLELALRMPFSSLNRLGLNSNKMQLYIFIANSEHAPHLREYQCRPDKIFSPG